MTGAVAFQAGSGPWRQQELPSGGLGRPHDALALHRLLHQIVPTVLRTVLVDFVAADIKLVARPRHRHIKQAPILLQTDFLCARLSIPSIIGDCASPDSRQKGSVGPPDCGLYKHQR